MGDVVALERAVAAEVSAALRQRLGEEVRLREATGETQSPEARARCSRPSSMRRDAREMASARDALDSGSAARLLLRADSLLARAEAGRPALGRAHAAARLGRRGPQPGSRPTRRGWRCFARPPNAPTPRPGPGGARPRRSSCAGRPSYRLAIEAAPGAAAARSGGLDAARATTWARRWPRSPRGPAPGATLSQLLRIRGRLAESDLAARRALAEDAYLDAAPEIRHRLFMNALWRGDYPQARDLCEQGYRQFPDEWRFTECRLTLLRNDRSRPPDPAAAWRLAAELDRIDPPARARAAGRDYSPLYRRVVAAAVSARAGDADSARAVVARARGEVAGNADLANSLDYDEAWVRLALGDSAGVRTLVARMIRYRPAVRAYLLRDPLVRGIPLPE